MAARPSGSRHSPIVEAAGTVLVWAIRTHDLMQKQAEIRIF
jgi:hypothetical protein